MIHQFSQVPKAEIQRSSFNRSHGLKTTFDGGFLVPIFLDEVLPGDTFNLRMHGFARMSTPLYPLMDNMKMETFFFFVPNRLLWENWERFNGQQDRPSDSTDYLMPTFKLVSGISVLEGDLGDYFGLPTGVDEIEFSRLPFRAYNLIFNEWFRDQNLQNSAFEEKRDTGDDYRTHYQLRRRGKRHDYFTSCLPWPQKGDAVNIPLGQLAPVEGIGFATNQVIDPTDKNVRTTNQFTTVFSNTVNANTNPLFIEATNDGLNSGGPNIYADLSQASTITINELREAFQIQRLLERDARGGTRYIEIIKSHFGVTSPDARLQRPEYLGGGSSYVNISPVASTVATAERPQGNLSAIGTASLSNHGFSKSFTEHGLIIGLINVRADLTYQQGINRMWSRKTRFDHYWPALAHLGEQAVLNKEIYAQGTAEDEDVFGYQERYAEYRYKPSMVTGLFRSQASQSLDAWHLAQDFASLPSLNGAFIQEDPPIDRVIAVPTEPHFIFDAYFDLKCARPMPLYGVPGLIDHF